MSAKIELSVSRWSSLEIPWSPPTSLPPPSSLATPPPTPLPVYHYEHENWTICNQKIIPRNTTTTANATATTPSAIATHIQAQTYKRWGCTVGLLALFKKFLIWKKTGDGSNYQLLDRPTDGYRSKILIGLIKQIFVSRLTFHKIKAELWVFGRSCGSSHLCQRWLTLMGCHF